MKISTVEERKAIVDEMAEENEKQAIAPYIWQFDSGKSGPTVSIFEAVHGNETYTFAILKAIMAIAKQQGVKFGKVITGIGSPGAFINNSRFLDVDLNRCFGEEMPWPKGLSGVPYEHGRTQILKPILARTDFLADMHATIKPAPPFLVAANLQHPHAKYLPSFGIKTVLTGDGLLPVCTDTFVDSQGGFGVTVENGWLENMDIDAAVNSVLKALKHMEVFDIDLPDNGVSAELDLLDAYKSLFADDGFEFTQEWGNFERIKAGTVFAVSKNGPYVMEEDSLILFPKPQTAIQEGMQVCMLAKPM